MSRSAILLPLTAFALVLVLTTVSAALSSRTSEQAGAPPTGHDVVVQGAAEPITALAPGPLDVWSGVPVTISVPPSEACQTVNVWIRLDSTFPHGRQWGAVALRAREPDNIYLLTISRHSTYFGMCANCAGGGTTAPSGPLMAKGWHMVSGVLEATGRQGGRWSLYIDGIPASGQPVIGVRVRPGAPTHAAISDMPEGTPGIIARGLTIFDTCLTPNQLDALHQIGRASLFGGDSQ